MSSSTFTTIKNILTLYGSPICMILGNLGNVFIAIIFSRQRESACALYLICSAVVNSIYLTFSSIAGICAFYYPDRTIRTIVFCKIYSYTLNFVGQVPKTMVILACIDRFLITSSRANFRAFSTPKRAKYIIVFSIIFWSLFLFHSPIWTTVVYGQCTAAGVYATFYSFYSLTFVSLIPTIISATFGYLTYRNMRQMLNRVQPVQQNTVNANINIQRRDRDLLIIVIAEVITYVVTTLLLPLIQLEMMISGYIISNKSSQYSQIEYFILSIAYFLLSVNSAVTFYTYLISSKSFRRDFKQLITNGYRKLTGQPPIETGSRTNRTLTQRETRALTQREIHN
jgi:hypothetical protein